MVLRRRVGTIKILLATQRDLHRGAKKNPIPRVSALSYTQVKLSL
jgi:hypothetical protein